MEDGSSANPDFHLRRGWFSELLPSLILLLATAVIYLVAHIFIYSFFVLTGSKQPEKFGSRVHAWSIGLGVLVFWVLYPPCPNYT